LTIFYDKRSSTFQSRLSTGVASGHHPAFRARLPWTATKTDK
jgi:hypothetical protein